MSISSKLNVPLAEALRPKRIEDFVGQGHIIGENGPIFKALQNGNIYSMIFWGSPGCGKTTLARVVASMLDAHFFEISPTTAGVKDIRDIVERSKTLFYSNKKLILFVDEIHRFNKAQQDYLLPHVENGTLVLIGATTENPSFEIVSPLLSRCKVYVFNPLSTDHIKSIIEHAIEYLKSQHINILLSEEAMDFLVQTSNGDARSVLNTLDALILTGVQSIELSDVKNVLQKSFNLYDKKGDEHYNTISAYIKSMRASDANAALYYLARMVDSGEDPKFIARRMVIFASEDIGIADKGALIVANSVFRACETIGYPECQINLAHGTVYMCQAPKNRSVCDAYFKALKDVKNFGNLPIPLHLRNAPTELMKDLGYGKNYEMYPKNTSNLPDKMKDRKYIY